MLDDQTIQELCYRIVRDFQPERKKFFMNENTAQPCHPERSEATVFNVKIFFASALRR